MINILKGSFSKNEKEYKIICKGYLNCEIWGNSWGEIENDLNRFFIKIIKLDISELTWADPTPLLSILLTFKKMRDDISVIKIMIPRIRGSKEGDEYLKGKFLKFLATQGFLKLMVDNFFVYDYKTKIKDYDIDKYSNYRYKLSYDCAEVIQARLFEINNSDVQNEIIFSIENEFMIKMKNSVSLQTYDMLATYFHNIVLELVENVYKHAYFSSQKKLFGIYVRRRQGASGSYQANSDDTMNRLLKMFNEEEKNCPALDNTIMMTNENVLEIFFVDIGMGISRSLKELYQKQLKKSYKYPIRELLIRVLEAGVRKNTSKIATAYGGLYLIYRIIRERKGYIWCKELDEWVGINSNKTQDGKTQIKTKVVNKVKSPKGLAWCFRLPFNVVQNSDTGLTYSWKGKYRENPVYLAYQKCENDLYINNIMCKDDRYNSIVLMNGDAKKWKYYSDKKMIDLNNILNINTYIWFPEIGYSKNTIIGLLKNYITNYIEPTNPVLEKANIIIADIDSNEIVNYYYTLKDLNLLTVMQYCNIDEIMLITKRWEVIIFKNRSDILKEDIQLTKEFLQITNSNNNYVHFSLTSYCIFLRKYESALFWRELAKRKEEKIFIHADIQWGSNIYLKGYLDFDRIYLFEDIYDILKRSLYRVRGIANENSIEFKSIDYTSTKICQDLNAELLYQGEDNISTIYVGSACATGYTRESYYKDNVVDMYVIFFANPQLKKQLSDTCFLFIWPDESYLQMFPFESKKYFRLGKTNLISSKREEKLIDSNDIYSNICRDKKKMYLDFSQKYPKFIKYGHYKTDRHHYLIGFDVITYMRYCYIRKDGAFLFVLTEIIEYLSMGNIDAIIDNLLDKEWYDVLKHYNWNLKSKHGDIVIYHSNTTNEYIMGLIKKILPVNIVKKIIPISIVEVQPKGAPITFSPFTMEKIHTTLDQTKNSGILYIDSSFSTGRNMMELENIFMANGCKKVDFLSIIDMRRLRNIDHRSRSYWKINIPRLDDDTECILCSTLKIINKFKEKIDGKAKTRINQWMTSWQCINVSNTIKDHGIIDDVKYSLGKLGLVDSTVINIYIAENLCESYNNDYVYNFIQRKTDLSISTKIQLICTQICLFGNQNSRQLQLSLLSELIGCMAKDITLSTYTSLGGIILVSQPEAIIYELLNEILMVNKNPHILSIRKFLLESQNYDLAIALAFFAKNDFNIEKLINKTAEFSNSNIAKVINSMLLPEKDLKLLCKEFEGLLINEQGNRHNKNINKLMSDHVTDYESLVERCNNAKNDIDRMYELTKHFPMSMRNGFALQEKSQDMSMEDLHDFINEFEYYMKQMLDNEKIINAGKESRQISITPELKSAVVNCEKCFKNILSEYFICYEERYIKYLQHKIEKYEEKYKKSITIDIKNKVEKVRKWYYWNSGIELEFLYLLDNLEHGFKLLEDNAYMKVIVDFDYNELTIKIMAWSNKTADQVKDKFYKENRLSKVQAHDFDVIFDFKNIEKNIDEGEYLLESVMCVPACYQRLID